MVDDTEIIVTDSDFIGRENELRDIANRLSRIEEYGFKKVINIEGMMGVGKTRFLNEILDFAEHDGWTVLETKCNFGDNISYRPIREMLRQYMDLEGSDTTSSIKRIKKTIKELMPDMLNCIPIIGSFITLGYKTSHVISTSNGESSVIQNFNEILSSFIMNLLNDFKFIISIDDIQWADNDTLSFMNSFIDRMVTEGNTVAIIFTTREEYLIGNDFLMKLIIEWKRNEIYYNIKLLNFNDASMIEFVTNIFKEYNIEFDMDVFASSGGNPLYIEQLIQIYLERNYFSINNMNISFIANGSTVDIPDGFEMLINSRILKICEKFGITIINVLNLAAIIGNKFPIIYLINTLEMDPINSNSYIKALVENLLFEVIEENGQTFLKFYHESVREVVLKNIPIEVCKIIHEKVAKTYELEKEPNILLCAYHYENSNNIEKGKQYSLSAGIHFLSIYSLTDAKKHFKKCHALSIISNDSVNKLISSYYLARIDYLKGDYTLSLFKYKNIKLISGQLHELDEGTLNIIISAYNSIGYILYDYGEYNDALEYYEKAMNLMENSTNDSPKAQTLVYMGYIHYDRGKLSLAKKCYIDALTICHKYPNYENKARCLNGLSYILYEKNHKDIAFKKIKQALSIAQKSHLLEIQSWSLATLGRYYIYMNDLPRAREKLNESLEISNSMGYQRNIVRCYNFLSSIFIKENDLNNSEQYLMKSKAICETMKYKRHEAITLSHLGKIMKLKRQYNEAIDYYNEAYYISRKMGILRYNIQYLLEIGKIYILLKDYEMANHFLKQALKYSNETENGYYKRRIELEFTKIHKYLKSCIVERYQ